VQNVTINRSTGMAEVSPATYLEKRSSKALTVLQEQTLQLFNDSNPIRKITYAGSSAAAAPPTARVRN
jgi:hypothetical protein